MNKEIPAGRRAIDGDGSRTPRLLAVRVERRPSSSLLEEHLKKWISVSISIQPIGAKKIKGRDLVANDTPACGEGDGASLPAQKSKS